MVRNNRPPMKLRRLLGLVLGCATSACTNDGPSDKASAAALSPVGIVGDSHTFALPTAMKVFGNRLLVASAKDSFVLRVLELTTGRIVARAPVGDSVGMLRVAWYLFPESYDPPAAWVYDVRRRELSLWDIGRNSLKEIRRFHPRMPMASGSRPLLTHSGIVVDAVYRGATLAIGEATGDSAKSIIGVPPFRRSDFPKDTNAYITANDLFPISDPSRTRLALFYKHVNRVDFFDIGTHKIITSNGPGEMPRPKNTGKFEWAELPDTHVNGQDGTARYVYSVYCGCTSAEWKWGRRGTVVRVFDWDGRFITDVQLDRHVTAIAVSPNDSVLYGAMQDPLPMIGRWLLPSSLRP